MPIVKVKWDNETLQQLFQMRKEKSVKDCAAVFGVTEARIYQILKKFKESN